MDDTLYAFVLLSQEQKKTNEADNVKNPSHYQIDGLGDSMDIIMRAVKHNTGDMEEGIYLFNTLKYLFRFGKKNGIEDLRKARNYLDMLIERTEKIREEGIEN